MRRVCICCALKMLNIRYEKSREHTNSHIPWLRQGAVETGQEVPRWISNRRLRRISTGKAIVRMLCVQSVVNPAKKESCGWQCRKEQMGMGEPIKIELHKKRQSHFN